MSASLRYLLDTNILSALIRNPHGPVAGRLRGVGEPAVCTSIIVAGELRFGARQRGSERLAERVEQLLEVVPVLPLDAEVDHHYAPIRLALEQAGTPIGPNDLWIAAQARAAGLCLVTDNIGEFGRVADLRMENWLA